MADLHHFDAAAANRALLGTRFAGRLQHFPTLDSTSTQLLAAAAAGAPEGTVYLADEQTAGRGRGNHRWHSSAGDGSQPAGLYVSALVHLPLPLREALWISLATGLATRQAIVAATSLAIDIRWPNDLLLGAKKLGGILVETAVEAGRLRYAVIGVGINLNRTEFPPDLAPLATSLALETGYPVERESLLIELLRTLDLELARLEAGGSDLLERFTAASTWVSGKRVHVAAPGDTQPGGYTGVTAGLDADGFLRVLTDDGTVRTVLSGGVREA